MNNPLNRQGMKGNPSPPAFNNAPFNGTTSPYGDFEERLINMDNYYPRRAAIFAQQRKHYAKCGAKSKYAFELMQPQLGLYTMIVTRGSYYAKRYFSTSGRIPYYQRHGFFIFHR